MVVNFSEHEIPAKDYDGLTDVVTKLVLDEINDFDENDLKFLMSSICGPFTCAIIHKLIKKGDLKIC